MALKLPNKLKRDETYLLVNSKFVICCVNGPLQEVTLNFGDDPVIETSCICDVCGVGRRDRNYSNRRLSHLVSLESSGIIS